MAIVCVRINYTKGVIAFFSALGGATTRFQKSLTGFLRNGHERSIFRRRLLIDLVLGGPTSVLGQLPPERKDHPSTSSDQGGRGGKSGSVQGGVRFRPDEGSVD
jgi:hypothetical protein